jgi:phosphotriesterase-related protein
MLGSEARGKALTVLGPVEVDSLGITLPHEHVLMDITAYFAEPKEATERRLAYQPVSMENLHWVCTHMMSNRDDLIMDDEELAIRELMRFKKAGGDTIVDMSCIGMGRDPQGLQRVSRATGLNIIMGTGYYVGRSHPPELKNMSTEQIADAIVKDITVGVGRSGIRAGIIGETGCSFPLEDGEKKVLRASARAQRETGVAVNVHPSRDDRSLMEIISILDEGGADLRRVVISHVGHFGFTDETLVQLAKAGCYLEFDTFGHPALPVEAFEAERRLLEMPSDAQRIYHLRRFIELGYIDQILISQDCCFKHKYVAYGGFGYAHILEHIIPWMRDRGITAEQINRMVVHNPKRVLEIP